MFSRPERMTISRMKEVLARSGSENLALSEQEFYELTIDESNDASRPGFVVGQAHAEWSEIDRQFMLDNLQWKQFATYQHAKRDFERRQAALADKGFIPSDMKF